MKVQCLAASGLFVILTITCFFPKTTISALKPKRTLNERIQTKTGAKEVRTGAAVAKRAERLKQTSRAFRQAVSDLEDRGLRAKYDAGLSLFFAKQQHHASRPQDIVIEDAGDPPPNTEEISYFSFDSPPEKYIGIVYSTLNGVTSLETPELLITDQITENLSYIFYDEAGNIAGRYFNADYYDLSPWGIDSQPAGYYESLVNAGKCVSGCGPHLLFQTPKPQPAPTPGPKSPVPAAPGPTPPARPMPRPGDIIPASPRDRAILRCEIAACVGIGWGCACSGPKWPICVIGGCGVIGPIMCHLTIE